MKVGSHPIHFCKLQVEITANQSHHVLPVGSPKCRIDFINGNALTHCSFQTSTATKGTRLTGAYLYNISYGIPTSNCAALEVEVHPQ